MRRGFPYPRNDRQPTVKLVVTELSDQSTVRLQLLEPIAIRIGLGQVTELCSGKSYFSIRVSLAQKSQALGETCTTAITLGCQTCLRVS